MSEDLPGEGDLVRSFRRPWFKKPPQGKDEPFSSYLARLSIDTFESQVEDEKAARQAINRIKAEAWGEGAAHAWRNHGDGYMRITQANPHEGDS